MARLIIVVDSLKDWGPYYPSDNVVSFEDYLKLRVPRGERVRLINLCRSYRYLSKGYYCALLAEARGHRVMPSVRTINELRQQERVPPALADLPEAMQRRLQECLAGQKRVTFTSFIGEAEEHLAALARHVFEQLALPLAEITLGHGRKWRIESIRPRSISSLDDAEQTRFAEALERFNQRVWRKPKTRRMRYSMAMLVNPQEQMPPSNSKALQKFIKIGARMGVEVEMIEKRDFRKLAEYDILFIRETTAIDHHTFRFARKAEAEGMVVIDDPTSIMRCTNKVFMADLFEVNNVPMPRTLILTRGHRAELEHAATILGFPLVLKVPDGAFSRGVIKVADEQELVRTSAALFRQSALLLAQEYLYTEFDWRIGVLRGKPLYACKYYMVRGHWQIYNHALRSVSGGWDTLPTHEVPKPVVQAALKAASLMGNGLYGVDVKSCGDRVAVVEVNDNPSIEADVEDGFLGDELYRLILGDLVERVEMGAVR